MSRTGAAGVHTYVPDARDGQILDFVKALEEAGRAAPAQRPALVGANGERVEIPEAMFHVLRQVAEALGNGMGVTVAPLNAMLTTQEAADFLGIARPTFVRILDRGDLPMERPGRHRYVRLADLVAYQDASRVRRAEALKRMAAEGEEDGLYAATEGPPPRTR